MPVDLRVLIIEHRFIATQTTAGGVTWNPTHAYCACEGDTVNAKGLTRNAKKASRDTVFARLPLDRIAFRPDTEFLGSDRSLDDHEMDVLELGGTQ